MVRRPGRRGAGGRRRGAGMIESGLARRHRTGGVDPPVHRRRVDRALRRRGARGRGPHDAGGQWPGASRRRDGRRSCREGCPSCLRARPVAAIPAGRAGRCGAPPARRSLRAADGARPADRGRDRSADRRHDPVGDGCGAGGRRARADPGEHRVGRVVPVHGGAGRSGGARADPGGADRGGGGHRPVERSSLERPDEGRAGDAGRLHRDREAVTSGPPRRHGARRMLGRGGPSARRAQRGPRRPRGR